MSKTVEELARVGFSAWMDAAIGEDGWLAAARAISEEKDAEIERLKRRLNQTSQQAEDACEDCVTYAERAEKAEAERDELKADIVRLKMHNKLVTRAAESNGEAATKAEVALAASQKREKRLREGLEEIAANAHDWCTPCQEAVNIARQALEEVKP